MISYQCFLTDRDPPYQSCCCFWLQHIIEYRITHPPRFLVFQIFSKLPTLILTLMLCIEFLLRLIQSDRHYLLFSVLDLDVFVYERTRESSSSKYIYGFYLSDPQFYSKPLIINFQEIFQLHPIIPSPQIFGIPDYCTLVHKFRPTAMLLTGLLSRYTC